MHFVSIMRSLILKALCALLYSCGKGCLLLMGIDRRVCVLQYKCGKVCLSLLGTFTGPGWTAASTILQARMSIASITA